MPLIYITGIAGSGKSTVQQELKKRGYVSYDADEPGIGAAHDKDGNIVKVPNVKDRSADWFATHSWRMIDGAIEKLKDQAQHEIVFLCGATTVNENTGVFDQTICLDIDESTLRKRVTERQNNDFGQSEEELQQILEAHKIVTEKYKRQDTEIIDATQSIDKVVDDILKHVH